MDDLLDGARALLPSLEWHRLESGTGVWALIPGARLRLSRDEDGCRAYVSTPGVGFGDEALTMRVALAAVVAELRDARDNATFWRAVGDALAKLFVEPVQSVRLTRGYRWVDIGDGYYEIHGAHGPLRSTQVCDAGAALRAAQAHGVALAKLEAT